MAQQAVPVMERVEAPMEDGAERVVTVKGATTVGPEEVVQKGV